MTHLKPNLAVIAMSAISLALPSISAADPIDIRRDAIVPIIFDDALSIRNSREGDRIVARSDDDRDLPRGTRFEGRVVGIRQARNNEPAMMDLEFTDLIMPDGSRHRIEAVPVPLNDRFVTRDRDGRFTAKKDTRRKGNSVLGGALGGFILGSIFQKQLEGVVLGTIAGIVIAETGSKNDGNVVIDRGARMGALFNREARFDYQGGIDNDWQRDDQWRRNDEWNRRDDEWNWDGRYDGREPRVSYNGRELRWDREKPYRPGQTIMVPLERTASQLGLRLNRDYDRSSDRDYNRSDDRRRDDWGSEWDRNGRQIFVEGPEGYLELQIGSRRARMNNRMIDLQQPVTERDRTVYVPLEVLGQLTRENVYMNGNRIPRTRF